MDTSHHGTITVNHCGDHSGESYLSVTDTDGKAHQIKVDGWDLYCVAITLVEQQVRYQVEWAIDSVMEAPKTGELGRK